MCQALLSCPLNFKHANFGRKREQKCPDSGRARSTRCLAASDLVRGRHARLRSVSPPAEEGPSPISSGFFYCQPQGVVRIAHACTTSLTAYSPYRVPYRQGLVLPPPIGSPSPRTLAHARLFRNASQQLCLLNSPASTTSHWSWPAMTPPQRSRAHRAPCLPRAPRCDDCRRFSGCDPAHLRGDRLSRGAREGTP